MAKAGVSGGKLKQPVNRHLTGLTGEFVVAAELARTGFSVAIPSGNAVAFDLLAYRDKQQLTVQVKSTSGASIQLNLGRFLNIETDLENGQQVIHGSRLDVDGSLLVVAVFIGQTIGSDRFYCAWARDFVEFVAEKHGQYLSQHGGMRPGLNKASLHAAFKELQLRDDKRFKTLHEILKTGQHA